MIERKLLSRALIPRKCIFIISFPRSGTHLTIDLLRKQFEECKAKLSPLESRHRAYLTLGHLSKKNPNYISQRKALRILKKAKFPIIKTHEAPEFQELDEENKAFIQQLSQSAVFFYIVRDAREVLTSLHCGLQANSVAARCSFSTFIRQEYEGKTWIKRWVDHVETWSHQPYINLVKYEDVIADPLSTIERLGKILNLEPQFKEPFLPSKSSPKDRWQDYWFRLTGNTESTAIDSFFSHQKSPWQRIMDKEDRYFFHQEAGKTLIELGYEEDDSWTEG